MSFFILSISLETASLFIFSFSARSFSSFKRDSLSCKAVLPPWFTYLKKRKITLRTLCANIETSGRLRTNFRHKGVYDRVTNKRELWLLRLGDSCLGKPLINRSSNDRQLQNLCEPSLSFPRSVSPTALAQSQASHTWHAVHCYSTA